MIGKETIKNRVETLLSKEFYCSLKDLKEKKTVYTVNLDAKQPYVKILAYRNCVVICTSEDLQVKVRELLQGKNRDEMFEFPLVYGQTIHYVPNGEYTEDKQAFLDFEYGCLFDEDILTLRGLTGFENSLAFDEKGGTSTKAVCFLRDQNRIVGLAGAAQSSIHKIWEIGVDVIEEYRNAKLGTYLVRKLTGELLERDITPFYSASITNIGSQMVASRCGYIPFWVDTFGTVLDGGFPYHNMVSGLNFMD